MRIHTRLVLGEVDGVAHLSDVMVECTRSDQLAFGSDFFGNLSRQVGHLQRVLEGAGSHLAHLLEQRVVRVGQFDERDVGHESECLFYQVEQRIGEEQQDAIDDQIVVVVPYDGGQFGGLHQFVGKIHEQTDQGHHQCGLEQLRAVLQLPQRVDGSQACGRFHHEKLEGMLQHDGTDTNHAEMGDECRSRVHEYPDDNRYERVGQQEYVSDGVAHHDRGE